MSFLELLGETRSYKVQETLWKKLDFSGKCWRVSGAGFKVCSLGFRVWDLGLRSRG